MNLGLDEYAERILDACSTYVLNACSDPGLVSKRAGKQLFLETSWSENEEGVSRKHIRPKWDWRVPESSVIQQEEGQEIRRQEEIQRQLLKMEELRPDVQQAQKQADTVTEVRKSAQSTLSSSTLQQPRLLNIQRKKGGGKGTQKSSQQFISNSSPESEQIILSLPNLDDDEPDRL